MSMNNGNRILRYWDRLNLEPFGGPKHVRYVALVPQAPALLRAAASFFRELGSTYEVRAICLFYFIYSHFNNNNNNNNNKKKN